MDYYDFDETDFNFDFDFDIDTDNLNKTRIHIPKWKRPTAIKYSNAQKLARDIQLNAATNYFVIVSGNFIFGDFIEALVERHRLKVTEMYISTLGMSDNNVDSIKNLLLDFGVEKINLIISHYFFGVERHNLIKYMIEEYAGLNIGVAVAGSHTKICLIKTPELTLVMDGSANLSSSANLENFSLRNDAELYKFNADWMRTVMENYTVIKGREQTTDFKNNNDNRTTKIWEKIGGDD